MTLCHFNKSHVHNMRKTRNKKRKRRVKQKKRKCIEQTFIEYLNKQSPDNRIRINQFNLVKCT